MEADRMYGIFGNVGGEDGDSLVFVLVLVVVLVPAIPKS
jgi:hypothetical protein